MNREPLVSIVTPTFNRANLLAGAIDSVRRQTYSRWEMLIWDDGSTDGTPELFQTCNDARIQYHRGLNHGPAYSRNQAMALAKGEYIAFIDSDDQWLPHKLSRQVGIMEKHGKVDILCANFENLETVTGQSVISFERNFEVFNRMKTRPLETKVSVIVDGFPESFLRRNFILPSSTIMRRGVYDSVGSFTEELRASEDKEYWWRCAVRGACFAYDDEVLTKRRKGEDSLSSSGEHARTEDINALHHCRQYALNYGREDLLPMVNEAIGAGWENLIRFYVEQAEKGKALRAFKRRCRYGISLRALALALGSLCGPGILRRAGSVRSAMR